MSPDEKHKQLIEKATELTRPASEKNIFALCGRGHYENATTDLLAFFIDPKEEHGFGTLFLSSLLEAAGLRTPNLELSAPPSREESTREGSRLDLIVDGSGWVLAIENKIRHHLANPLENYVAHIAYRNPSIPESDRHFVVLAIKGEKPKLKNWHAVTWRNYVDCIKRNSASSITAPTNLKWHVIMREFLLNIEQECGDMSMNEERIALVRDHYKEVVEIEEMRKEYLSHMAQRGCDALRLASCAEPWTKQHNWGVEGIAIRLHTSTWGERTNIVLLLRKDGRLRIQFYVHDISDEEAKQLRKDIDSNKYSRYWEEPSTIRCFGLYDGDLHDVMFAEITNIAKILNEFLEARR